MMKMTHVNQKDTRLAIQLRLLMLHGIAVSALYFGWSLSLLALAFFSTFIRMLAVEGGYHRYFSHHSFKTSRWFQCFLAIAATSSGQRGVLSWAALHRQHHRYADQPKDPHSPIHNSFWYSHIAWLWSEQYRNPSIESVKDFRRFPELLFLDRYHFLCTFGLMGLLFCWGEYTTMLGNYGMGWDAVLWGFFIPTLFVFHATMSINSLFHHTGGYRRFDIPDASRNISELWWLTAGACYHNNHHRYSASARAGMYPGEIDITYYVIKMLGKLGLVWDIREVPASVLQEGIHKKEA